MIDDKNSIKIRHFYEFLEKMSSPQALNIGLIVINNESMGDLIALAKNSNATAALEIIKEMDIADFIRNLAKNLNDKKMVFIRLHNYLDPKIYNQFYLIANNARMEYFEGKKDIIINIPSEAQLIVIMTNEELEALNYKDILNIFGPVLRLE